MVRLIVAASLFSLPAAALDPFEIQVYDGSANGAGEAGTVAAEDADSVPASVVVEAALRGGGVR